MRELRRLGVVARLLARSRGESRPRATNDTLAGRWSNRRVELRVLRQALMDGDGLVPWKVASRGGAAR